MEKSILKGNSIALCFPEHKILSSAIVGGSLPISTGVALALKLKKSKNKVYCFIGDMTSETGIAHECIKFSQNFNLPIIFVIEDNDLSVCTETRVAWGKKKLHMKIKIINLLNIINIKISIHMLDLVKEYNFNNK